MIVQYQSLTDLVSVKPRLSIIIIFPISERFQIRGIVVMFMELEE